MKKLLESIKSALSTNALLHPKWTFSSAIAGVVAITQSPEDFNTLMGPHIGPKVHVLSKWFGAFCMAVCSAGRSVIPAVDNPKGSA